jgi:Uma2 family endonuclease
VLSKSTEAYDRGRKFAAYRSMPSLRDYVLVSQTEPRIEVFSRVPDDKWTINELVGLDSLCRIPGLNCEIALAEIYFGISFNPD